METYSQKAEISQNSKILEKEPKMPDVTREEINTEARRQGFTVTAEDFQHGNVVVITLSKKNPATGERKEAEISSKPRNNQTDNVLFRERAVVAAFKKVGLRVSADFANAHMSVPWVRADPHVRVDPGRPGPGEEGGERGGGDGRRD